MKQTSLSIYFLAPIAHRARLSYSLLMETKLTTAQVSALRTFSQAGLFRAGDFKNASRTIAALVRKGALDKYADQYRVSAKGSDLLDAYAVPHCNDAQGWDAYRMRHGISGSHS